MIAVIQKVDIFIEKISEVPLLDMLNSFSMGTRKTP